MVAAFDDEIGNAGSRTHEFGLHANKAVAEARHRVAAVVRAQPLDVVFTSGATEANNLAILGLQTHGEATRRRHIISSAIEHKAVLEPLQVLEARGFEVTYLAPGADGRIGADTVCEALRPDTLLVSLMHGNNETGALQPITEVADTLVGSTTLFHVDAAQTYGKVLEPLAHPRIDLISVSAHKLFGPKGVGALIARTRKFQRPPLQALMYGGGQERGLRPGTLPVPLIVGFGVAAELALNEHVQRAGKCRRHRTAALAAFRSVAHIVLGSPAAALDHILSVAFPGVDSEALILATKDLVAISNGAACTSARYEPSHVLKAMGASDAVAASAVRLSWCHLTQDAPWDEFASRVRELQAANLSLAD
jgi:cysteine desulfurase